MTFDELLTLPPYGLEQERKEEILLRRLAELTEHHRTHCAAFARLLAVAQPDYSSPGSLADVPYLPVALFKTHRLCSVAQNEIAHAVDAHGTESSTVGTEWIDVNNNIIEDPIYRGYAVRIRGGMGLVWSNTFIGYNEGVELTQDTDQPTGPVYIWDDYIFPETSPMVRARGTMGTPIYYLSPAPDYVPYPYPHPLIPAGAGR